MRCANPNCRATAENLLKGVLALVEFETPPEDRLLFAGGGFPVCSARSRYFWLCETCSKHLAIKKWNAAGLVLVPVAESTALPTALQSSRIPVSKESSAPPNRREKAFGIA
jgi:hypothetical protein